MTIILGRSTFWSLRDLRTFVSNGKLNVYFRVYYIQLNLTVYKVVHVMISPFALLFIQKSAHEIKVLNLLRSLKVVFLGGRLGYYVIGFLSVVCEFREILFQLKFSSTEKPM